VQAVKTYEELTVEAALTGDQGTAIAALMVNPLVGSYPKARAFLDRVLENERPYLPRFFD
jgi:6-phospho-beta-glucosidase